MLKNEATRAYLYRTALAALVVTVAYGVIDGDDSPLWLELVGAVLGIGSSGLATLNTSRTAR